MIDHRFAFIVRIWFERDSYAGTAYTLRGSLQKSDSEEIHYFESVEAVTELLRALINQGHPDAESRSTSQQ